MSYTVGRTGVDLILSEGLRGFHLRCTARRQISTQDAEQRRKPERTRPDPRLPLEPRGRLEREPRDARFGVRVPSGADRERETDPQQPADDPDQRGLAEHDQLYVGLGGADGAHDPDLASALGDLDEEVVADVD